MTASTPTRGCHSRMWSANAAGVADGKLPTHSGWRESICSRSCRRPRAFSRSERASMAHQVVCRAAPGHKAVESSPPSATRQNSIGRRGPSDRHSEARTRGSDFQRSEPQPRHAIFTNTPKRTVRVATACETAGENHSSFVVPGRSKAQVSSVIFSDGSDSNAASTSDAGCLSATFGGKPRWGGYPCAWSTPSTRPHAVLRREARHPL
jgi:hypothetical protein